jgi:hypothetical protein
MWPAAGAGVVGGGLVWGGWGLSVAAGWLWAGGYCWASQVPRVVFPSWAFGPGSSVRSLIRAPE